jgi:ribosomal protein RSM22 (predicted rRNA methylase)
VRLPFALREAVEQEIAGVARPQVSLAAEKITSDYKSGRFAGSLDSEEARAAYLITRLPATYATCTTVFREVARLASELAPESLLDLGAGPGTASWAAAETWTRLREFTLLEGNREFVEIGKRLAKASDRLQSAEWMVADLRASPSLPTADVVVLSYTIGELSDALGAVRRAWTAARTLLVIIEPGTPRNFKHVALVRQELILGGGHLVAPCPNELDCPMARAHDWCHFAVRLERTSEHRRMKGGALGYEDEKFSYLAFAKQPLRQAEARIVRHPMTHSGFIRLTLCSNGELRHQTVTRSQKEAFRAARRAKWGDEWRQVE